MRLTIFSRLSIGYVIIFLLATAASVHAIKELFKFKEVISILEADNRIGEFHRKLTDTFLSEISNEKKFTILRDRVLHDQAVSASNDFNRYLDELKHSTAFDRDADLLAHIETLHLTYVTLFSEEAEIMRTTKRYPHEAYKREKEQAIDSIAAALKELEQSYKRNTYEKIRALGRAGVQASQVVTWTSAASLVFVIVLSILITRSITKPLSALKDKTKEIAAGNFEARVDVSSSPEMEELAEAFNSMCVRLKEVDKMKSDFYSLMSHELRTPLTSIKEGTNLLLEGVGGDANEKQKRLLTIISQESQRLINLVNSLLDLSKMEAGMTAYHFSRLDLTRLIQKAITEIEPLSEAKKIVLHTEIGAGLALMKIDGERILQVLRNLIGNAVKFTPPGGKVKIAVRTVTGGVEVSVSDSGPGIPNENLATIFDKFHQVTRARSSEFRGTGLGLAIVKHIIHAHGGKVWAESESGQGSTFTFVLPV